MLDIKACGALWNLCLESKKLLNDESAEIASHPLFGYEPWNWKGEVEDLNESIISHEEFLWGNAFAATEGMNF